MIGSLVLVFFFTSPENFIAINQENPCLKKNYGDFQKCCQTLDLTIAEIMKPTTAQNSLISFLGSTDIDWKKVYMLPRNESNFNNTSYLNKKLLKFKVVVI